MKIKTLLILINVFLFFSSPINAEPINIESGVYISQINNLDFSKGSYQVILWAWWNHSIANFQPAKSVEIIGAQSVKWEIVRNFDLPNGKTHTEAKISATISQLWDTSNYPFDTQYLKLVLESADTEADKLQFIPDKNSTIEPTLSLNEWRIGALKSQPESFEYPTNFGFLNDKVSSYPRLVYEIPIQRNGTRVFVSNLTGYLVATLLLLIVSLTNSTPHLRSVLELSPRMAMSGAAIFLSIGNKNSIDASLPIATNFSNIDVIQIFIFSLIPIVIFSSIYTEYYAKSNQKEKANRVGKTAFVIHTLAFLCVTVVTTYNIANS